MESGTFKVDRKRALSKLMRFQLPDPWMFSLMIVRCAVASGATRVSLRVVEGRDFEARFDGRPFTEEELAYPYGSLFERARKGVRRNRQLAIALLSMLRLEPKWILVRSGEAGRRFLLRVQSLETESVEPANDKTGETVVRAVARSGWGSGVWSDRIPELVRERCKLSPIPVEVRGVPIRRFHQDEAPPERLSFHDGDARGWLEIPETERTKSSLEAYRYGVLVGSVIPKLPKVQVTGVVNNDRFSLNASQSGVIRNKRYKDTVKVLSAQADALILRTISVQAARMPKTGRYIHSASLLQRWRDLLDDAAGEKASGLMGFVSRLFSRMAVPMELKGHEPWLAADAKRTHWLRRTAARLLPKSRRENETDPVRKALWDAKIFLGTSLQPLSLADLAEQYHRLGHIPVSRFQHPTLPLGFQVLLEESDRQRDLLSRWFGSSFNTIEDFLRQEKRFTLGESRRPEALRPTLERVGQVKLLVRDEYDYKVPAGPGRPAAHVKGEIALPLHRPPDGSRIHVFFLGRPVRYLDVRGDLRFAAVAVPGGERRPGALPARFDAAAKRAAWEAATKLYKRAAQEYDPSNAGEPRQRALRDHLLDFLFRARRKRMIRRDERHWIASVPLFHGQRPWSFERLATALEAGATLFFASKRQDTEIASLHFTDRRFTPENLKRLFRDAGVTPYPDRPDVRMVYKKAPRGCGHTLGEECLIEFRHPGGVVHLAPGEGKGGNPVDSPWGPARAFGPGTDSVKLTEKTGLAMLEGILRERGAFIDEQAHPARHFILRAVRHFFAPWPGRGLASLRHRRLLELLTEFPLFRDPDGKAWSLKRLDRALVKARHIRYMNATMGKTAKRAELILDDDELVLVMCLWPADRKKLLPARRNRTAKRQLRRVKKTVESFLAEERKRLAAAAPKPKSPPPAPKPRPTVKPLAFGQPVLYQEELSYRGMRAMIALPEEPLPGLHLTIRGRGGDRGHALRIPSVQTAVRLLLDVTRYTEPVQDAKGLDPSFVAAVRHLVQRFFGGLIDTWPKLAVHERTAKGLLMHILLFMQPPKKGTPPPLPSWTGLQERIRDLALFPAVGRDEKLSLRRLEKWMGDKRQLFYMKKAPASPTEEMIGLPLLAYARLTSKALGRARLRRVKPRPPARAKPPPAAVRKPPPLPAGPIPPAPFPATPVEEKLEKLFAHLRGRRGIDMDHCPKPETAALVSSRGRKMLPAFHPKIGAPDLWRINRGHSDVARVLDTDLEPGLKAAYLASMAYTEVNRKLKSVTDEEDTAFQQALAERLLREL